jgi:hypothetical protein
MVNYQKYVQQYWMEVIFYYICTHGRMAEWLGTALQKLLQRFESAFDLKSIVISDHDAFFVL